MRLGMRCRLSPTADVPSHTSGAAMGPLRDISRPLRGGFENWLSGAQLIQQGLGFLQIERIEPFSKPAVDRSEQIAGRTTFALVAPEPRHAHCGAQLKAPSLLLLRDGDGG